MIFATVGTQLAFPRLMDALEALAPGFNEKIVAQTGPDHTPRTHLDTRTSLTPAEFETLFSSARLVVGHAGIGTLLMAQRLQKSLVILPRQHALGEHRNDHQLATARQIERLPGVYVAWEADDLGPLLSRPDLAPASDAPSAGRETLVARIRGFIDQK